MSNLNTSLVCNSTNILTSFLSSSTGGNSTYTMYTEPLPRKRGKYNKSKIDLEFSNGTGVHSSQGQTDAVFAIRDAIKHLPSGSEIVIKVKKYD